MKRVCKYIWSIELDIQLSQTLVNSGTISSKSTDHYRISKFQGNANFDERGSLIDFENPITRIGDRENDLGWFRMIPRPWESRGEVFPRSSIRKLGNFGASFGELYEFEVIPVPNFYLSLTNCTFVPASNFYGIPNYISIELSSTYRAKYPLQHNLRTLLYVALRCSKQAFQRVRLQSRNLYRSVS